MSIKIHKIDEAWAKIECDQGIAREISEMLTFEVPNARFSPAYKKKFWDGKIRLLNSRNNTIYAGLYTKIVDFAKSSGYDIEVDSELAAQDEVSLSEMGEFAKSLGLPVEPRDYQIRAACVACRNRRAVLVSPTASGKSLIAYLLTRWYNKKTLIVVPTISLVIQMIKDFESYGFKDEIHGIMGGVDKNSDAQIFVSTWQSVYEMDEDYFEAFDVIIGDEAHLFKAKSLIAIMTKMRNTKYRFGMTGTLDGAEVNELVLEGLFGKIEQVTTTSNLIKDGSVANLNIKILVLSHDKKDRILAGENYQDELQYIVSCDARNRFIRNLAVSLKGNTLVLYALVEKHGQLLYDLIAEKSDNCHFIHGGVEAEERDAVRHITEKSDNSIIVASYGTFSTGINIRNLHNVIFASPTKSRVRTLQSIGRGLRKSDTKESCVLFDIADDISRGGRKNYTLNHLVERVKMYSQEGFPYDIHTINLKGRNE